MNADEIRSKLVDLYKKVEPHAKEMATYSQEAAALTEEYHKERLTETFPEALFFELTPVVSLNARETPTSLDKKLIELTGSGAKIPLIIHDRFNHQYHIYAGKA